jgi:hypothetical protein
LPSVEVRKITQQLKSGLIIRQDFGDSVRFVMFETGVEGWEYATHGGTAFVVKHRGKYFGITCGHCIQDFNWRQLAITETRFGTKRAGLKSIYRPSKPTGGAVDSDVLDIVVIEFAEDSGSAFFEDRAYVIDPQTVTASRPGDRLLVNGALKASSTIGDETITAVFALLDFIDNGAEPADPTLRRASANFENLEFDQLTGLSGSPVFNVTEGKLCGVMVRGGLNGGRAVMRYVDIADVVQILDGIATGAEGVSYIKIVPRPISGPKAEQT